MTTTTRTRYQFTVRRSGLATLVQHTNPTNGRTSRMESYRMDDNQFVEWLEHTRSNGHDVEVKVNGQPAFLV